MEVRNFLVVSVLGLVLGSLLFFSTPAQAAFSLSYGDPTATSLGLQQIADEAQAPLPDMKVVVRTGACPGKEAAAGCARLGDGNNGEIFMYAPFPRTDKKYLKHVFYHEIGHLFDYRYLTEKDQRALKITLGYSGSSEWGDPNNGIGGIFTPSAQEWFAEAASYCYMGAAYEYPAYSYPYGYGPETTSVCNTMRRVSSRIEPTRQTWKKVIYGPKKKFVIPKRFETSSIRITLKIKNKTYRWGNSCESSEKYKGVYVYLRGCEQTLSGKIIGRGRVEITYSGISYTDY